MHAHWGKWGEERGKHHSPTIHLSEFSSRLSFLCIHFKNLIVTVIMHCVHSTLPLLYLV